ncbi:uncharacterized protein N7496_011852 [Penicillium cataractarum]|uniref:C2H2-type domain-containing protein n=1 Tax=Penicillium cataractarum TaxID=2100454 RepID=A0A9W9UWP0_9EURO|nr:uncharacterized protein N7496_011852 [Penicillium cataractarum]KAJ5359439.1 hypothetical protein N7496_011852 [Penicillium cataractarum]
MMSFTAHELSMLSGPFYGQVPPRYNDTSTPFMADSFEYETHNPGSQLHTPTPLPKKGSVKKTLVHRSKKQTNPRPTPPLLICKWSTCTKPFSRKATLVRHVVTQHVDPGSVPCLDEECIKVFNRKDNMMSHFRTVHVDDW